MTRESIRTWYGVHKWTSLVCTVFLILLCVTGLPLIFYEEIDALGQDSSVREHRPSERLRDLDDLVRLALAARPGEVPLYVSFDEEKPLVYVTTGPRPEAAASEMSFQTLDHRTGKAIPESSTAPVMEFLFHLHTDVFAGLPGLLFMGFMGLLFFVSIVSGVVVYAPFMRKLDFGTVRTKRSSRVKWLDYHNLLGIVTVAWASVVGLTGVINTLSQPIAALWQANQLATMTSRYAGQPMPTQLTSLDAAVETARAAAPEMKVQFVAYPGTSFSSRHHYAVFMQGATPLTKKLLKPALIDAENGRLTDMRAMPWYAQALLLSQPLHFGDYGGMPMKVLWALLDVVTIVVLGSGVYLWLGRRRSSIDVRLAELQAGGVTP